ncbi:uncharacterized protein [Parasteatoda tepidariorum]|uniref:uncharacterized protein n=1 Tax=Parasteatoda tepidariorum TaxID=114398 RepID=UPI001C72170D|nr:uncharacterized protein LOC107438275 [Parasteatoda tepidariorum]
MLELLMCFPLIMVLILHMTFHISMDEIFDFRLGSYLNYNKYEDDLQSSRKFARQAYCQCECQNQLERSKTDLRIERSTCDCLYQTEINKIYTHQGFCKCLPANEFQQEVRRRRPPV